MFRWEVSLSRGTDGWIGVVEFRLWQPLLDKEELGGLGTEDPAGTSFGVRPSGAQTDDAVARRPWGVAALVPTLSQVAPV